MNPSVDATDDERVIIERAIAEWHAGEHYDAHETLEELVDLVEDNDDDWTIGLAIVRIAACAHKYVHEVGPGAIVGKLERALENLEGAPSSWKGIDLAALREESRAFSAALAVGTDQPPVPLLRRASAVG